MRIAIAAEIFLPKQDGVTLDLSNLLQHLKSQGHQAIVFGPGYSVKSACGFRVLRCPGFPVGLYPGLRCSIVTPDLAAALVAFRPDLVYVIDPFFIGTQILCFARVFLPSVPVVVGYSTNVPFYTSVFGYPHITPIEWQFLKLQHAAGAATVCRSPSTACQLANLGWDEDKIRVWPGGVDGILFHPGKRDSRLRELWLQGDMNNGSEKVILAYVGRVSWEKNLEALLEVYEKLDKMRFHLVVVGDGPAKLEFASFLNPKTVTFTGWLRGEDLAIAFASADVFVFPSVSETFGNVVVEAMAAGLAVVAFDTEGIKDSVVSGTTGFLVPAGATATFSSSIEALADDKVMRARMGRAGRERVKGWTLERSVQECERILVIVSSLLFGDAISA
ncbi:UDP-Glycosyltransferase/glycogen phosphorylase [Thozetella sp. PMI_491]|nr:UDP-Glycosyltransferase/glycogen phosphorylase [Thozetella sp. PMI_491]